VKPELQSADKERAVAGLAEFVRGAGRSVAIAASIYAVHHRRAVASVSATSGSAVYRARCVSHFAFGMEERAGLEQFSLVQETIVALRNIRAEMKLEPKKKVAAEFSSADERTRKVIESSREGIMRLVALSEFKVSAERVPQSGGAVRSTALFDVRIPYVAETIDVDAEAARLRKQIEGLEKRSRRRKSSWLMMCFAAGRRRKLCAAWKRLSRNRPRNCRSCGSS